MRFGTACNYLKAETPKFLTHNNEYTIFLCHLCFRVGKPVRCMLDRDEDMKSTGTRHPFLAKYKVQYIFYDDAYWSILIQSVLIIMQADLPKILTGIIEVICVVHGLLLYLTRVYLIHLLRRLSVFRLFSPLAVFYFERVFFHVLFQLWQLLTIPFPFKVMKNDTYFLFTPYFSLGRLHSKWENQSSWRQNVQ